MIYIVSFSLLKKSLEFSLFTVVLMWFEITTNPVWNLNEMEYINNVGMYLVDKLLSTKT